MALKFEIPVQTNLLSAVSELAVIKFYETQRVKVEFGRSAFPQYLVYSEFRKIHPNHALHNFLRLWTITLLQNLTSAWNCQKQKSVTKILEMSQNQNQKVGHPGHAPTTKRSAVWGSNHLRRMLVVAMSYVENIIAENLKSSFYCIWKWYNSTWCMGLRSK